MGHRVFLLGPDRILTLDHPHFGLEAAAIADPAGDADPVFLGDPAPIVHIDGHAGALPTGLADFWAQNIIRTLFAAGVQMGFSSSSAADAAAGTGLRTMRAWLLKNDYTIVYEDIVLNGQTKVNSTGTNYLSCLRMRALTVGSGGVNAGDIYAYDTSDTVTAGVPQTATKIAGRMLGGFDRTHHGWYCVPAGKKALLLSYRFSTMDATAVVKYGRGLLYFQPFGEPMQMVPMGQFCSSSVPEGFKPVRPRVFDEKTWILFRGNASAAVDAAIFAELLLVNR